MESKKVELNDEQYAIIGSEKVHVREEPDYDGAFHHGMDLEYDDLIRMLKEGYMDVDDL